MRIPAIGQHSRAVGKNEECLLSDSRMDEMDVNFSLMPRRARLTLTKVRRIDTSGYGRNLFRLIAVIHYDHIRTARHSDQTLRRFLAHRHAFLVQNRDHHIPGQIVGKRARAVAGGALARLPPRQKRLALVASAGKRQRFLRRRQAREPDISAAERTALDMSNNSLIFFVTEQRLRVRLPDCIIGRQNR